MSTTATPQADHRAQRIRQWAEARNLISGSDPFKQLAKLTEEIGELAAGLSRGNMEAVKDGIGDARVVLTILAAQVGLEVEDCDDTAWHEIKDRKGRMLDGVFVKEADLGQALRPRIVEPDKADAP